MLAGVKVLDRNGVYIRELGAVSQMTLSDGKLYQKREFSEPSGVAVSSDKFYCPGLVCLFLTSYNTLVSAAGILLFYLFIYLFGFFFSLFRSRRMDQL